MPELELPHPFFVAASVAGRRGGGGQGGVPDRGGAAAEEGGVLEGIDARLQRLHRGGHAGEGAPALGQDRGRRLDRKARNHPSRITGFPTKTYKLSSFDRLTGFNNSPVEGRIDCGVTIAVFDNDEVPIRLKLVSYFFDYSVGA